MTIPRHTKIAAAALLVAAAAGGGAYAAASHGGPARSTQAAAQSLGSFVSSQAAGTTRSDRGVGHGPADDLAAAATYLGLTQTELQTELQAGKTLAQIADATSGKSKAGLIAALVSHEKAELAQAVKDGKLTQAQADQLTTTLTDRFTNLVNGVDLGHHGHGFGPGGHGPGDDLAAAATYLGLTQTELQTELQAGKTLAQIADATSGKSKAGLIAALVSHEKAELAQAVKDGKLTQAQADQLTTTLTDRFTNLVNGVDLGHHGHGFGPGFGPPPAGGSNGYRPGAGTHI